jgi:hypothetical protein
MKEAMKHPMAVALIVPVLILGIFGLVHMATSGSAEEPNAELAAEIAEIRQLHRDAAGLVARIEAVSTEEPPENSPASPWSQLATGMDPAAVQKLLGPPDRVVDHHYQEAVAELQVFEPRVRRRAIMHGPVTWIYGDAGRGGIVVFERMVAPTYLPMHRARVETTMQLVYAVSGTSLAVGAVAVGRPMTGPSALER